MASLISGSIHPVSLPEPERPLARVSSESISNLLLGSGGRATLRLEDPQSGAEIEVPVPVAAVQILAEALGEMAQGHPVALIPVEAELSTQQAAEMMGVSRPYFVKLLEQGLLPYRKIGDQRRVRYQDLVRFLADHQHRAMQALDEMAADGEALGLYE